MTSHMMEDEDETKRNFPEEWDGYLECASLIVCCSFNKLGTLLATGCNDGRVSIWDFLTRCEVRDITAHAGHPITSISWSRNGRSLATSALDNSLAIWDVESKDCKLRWFSNAPIMKVQFNPKNEKLVLTCFHKHPPTLLKINYEDRSVQPLQIPIDKEDDVESNIIASFDKSGQRIYTGNAKGRITIIESPTSFPLDDDAEQHLFFNTISSFKIQQIGAVPSVIRDIEFAPRDKRYFLVNSTDRSVRLYECESALKAGLNGNCEETRKFQEVINKPLWRRCCFSGEKRVTYVCGGSARQNALYIWDIETGAVKKILSAPTKSEALLDVQWHPSKPVLVSVSNGGFAHIWARAQVENWSAYAPTFKELDENNEYSEPESEFDIEDEDEDLKVRGVKKDLDHSDIEIDVQRFDKDEDYDDDDDASDGDNLEFIPLPFSEAEKPALV